MPRMLPGIDTLAQHQEQLQNDPDAYRPERCPQCGKAGLHHHGYYERNPPRGEGLALSLGPLRILRFCWLKPLSMRLLPIINSFGGRDSTARSFSVARPAPNTAL